jgi:hypothetical protein
VLRWQPDAGTVADRQAARDRLAAAAAALADEETGEAKLIEQIQQLQSKLNSMRREQSAAAAAIEKQERAVIELRKLVPKHVLDRVERLKHGATPARARLATVHARLTSIAKHKAFDVTNLDGRRQANLVAQSAWPEAVRQASDPASPFLDFREWQKYLESLDAEAAELQGEVAELTAIQQEAAAAEQAARDHYAR